MAKTIILPPGIASYANLLEPKADQKGKLKYSVTVLISKARATELDELKKLALATAVEKWGAQKGPIIFQNQKHPLIKDGDKMIDEETGKPKAGYAGMLAVSTRGDRKPKVLDAKKQEIFTDEDVYSGCMIRVYGSVFAYDVEGNKGISVGLNHVQVLKKGERLDGRKAAEEVFEEWTDPEADPLA